MVRYCDQCGNELKAHAIFCPHCGAKSDLPPETTVKNESGENKLNNNAEKVENKTETIGTKIDNTISNTNAKNANSIFDINNVNWNTVIKYSVVGTIISLILGIIFFALFKNTASTPPNFGLLPYSFILAVILAMTILAAHIKEKINAILVGGIVGLLTGILQFTIISIVFVINGFALSIIFGDPILLLIVVGIVFAYVSNVYLKDKINIHIVNEYLGE